MQRVRVGDVSVNVLTFQGALDAVTELVERGQGGAVFTPNVDHVVQCRHDARFKNAYAEADLCLADGMPIVWASRLLGPALPERIAGADLFLPLMRRAAEKKWRVFLLGATDAICARARDLLADMGVTVVGSNCAWVKDPTDAAERAPLIAEVNASNADLLVVCMGAPKQELLIQAARKELPRTVAIGLGATLNFFVGETRRAPKWMSKLGLEWLHRLVQEPRRMAHRYLVRDRAFFGIVAESLFAARRVTPSLPAPANP